MNSNRRYMSISLFFIFLFLGKINCNSSLTFDYDKILEKNYKSSLELIFDREIDYDIQIAENDPIRKNYHKFKETELNLMNGVRMKCYTPSKVKNSKGFETGKDTITQIKDEHAYLFLRDVINLCFNAHMKEWYYKICPTKKTTQVLSYKKKNQTTGIDYTETWVLGQREPLEFNKNELYLRETNDTLSQNIQPIPITAKIFNYDLSVIKDFDVNLEIEYDLEELKLYDNVFINKYYKSLDEYVSHHPNVNKIPVQRRILKLVNKHLVLLESPFPSDNIFYNKVNLSIIKQKVTNDSDHSFSLYVYKDYIYCFRCEFLLYYKIGDSLFIKNGKFSDALKHKFKETAYKSRKIVKIIDNQLIKVEKSYPSDFNGLVMRNYYFIFDSSNKKLNWINGRGIVKVKNRLIIGTNTKFREQFNKGDILLLFNINRVLNDFHSTSTNTKLYEYEECIVDKILSNNLLLTKKKCPKVYMHKGDYFIGKPFNYSEGVYTNSIKNKQILSLYDFTIFESLNINFINRGFVHGEFLFHPGLIVHKSNDTVFRMKIEKTNPTESYLRILFGTDLDYYKEKKLNYENDHELIIYSQTGALIKKIKDDNISEMQFYDTQVRSLFQDSMYVDIIFKNNAIYFSTSDVDKESSIKIKYPLGSASIKYIYFDIKESNNVILKEIEKINMVEKQFLFNIFVFEKRLKLAEDAFWIEEYLNGDYCRAADTYRKTVVEYKCDKTGNNDIHITEVEENKTCEYKYSVVSRHLCNPIHLMRYQIESAVTKTKCVAINNIYNSNSKDYFRDINH